MADFDRGAARARRDEIRQAVAAVYQPEMPRLRQLLGALDDADALDAALSVSEQQTAALRQDNERLRVALADCLVGLCGLSEDSGAGDPYAIRARAALSVQPKEPDGE